LRLAGSHYKFLLMIIAAALAISQFAGAEQATAKATTKTTTTADQKSASAKSPAAIGKLPKLWRSDATKHDFRVEVTGDLFRAEWVNIPAAVAKQGAYIRTECRRTGAKWVGSSKINMAFAIPGAPTGKDTKMCSLTVRFEVDSISAEKITGHSEAIKAFDVNACRAEQMKWAEFSWVPKK
jgi:hypothetical protein